MNEDKSRAERRKEARDELIECVAGVGALLLVWLVYWVFV